MARSALDWVVATAPTLLVGIVIALGFWLLLRSRRAKRVFAAIEETMLSNWRLALLGATGIVLSAASGYTTWDGMRHFTGDAVLSGMITFGIQGVMLIIAWLIGESFATGMSQRTAPSPGSWTGLSRGGQAIAGGVLGVILFIMLAALLMPDSGSGGLLRSPPGPSEGFSHRLLIFGAGLVFAALIALYSASDLVRPYLQGSRLVIRNAMLWVMFLACMATSVFFSFDSLFSAIFPQAERVRAAELRAQNQVAGMVADIGATIAERRVAAADELFRSEAWAAYEAQLAHLAREAQTAQGEIEKVFNDQLEARNRAVKAQQERIVTAQSGQAGLAGKKAALGDELNRLKGERPTLAAELAQKKTDLDNRAKEIDAKRVEAIAEDKGVEGTGKEGKGPVWRQRRSELARLQDYYAIGEERVKDAQRRLDAGDARIAQIEREVSAIDGELARLQGEAETAEQRIRLLGLGEAPSSDGGSRADPGRVLGAFDAARAEFRRDPTTERLTAVQQQCATLHGATLATPAARDRVTAIDCDPKQVAEAAALVFALNAGQDAFGRTCAGAERIGRHKTADDLFGFARACLADSALPSRETEELRGKINFVELNRDDKAHRFVVTINAFNDGNRLAYLALGIAVAIDSLIFMSGLFGANAVRSPLSDVPSFKARNAQQLEAIIENALLPDTFENARLALHAMRPITNAEGFMAEVRLARLDPHAADRVLTVLNAGATIHAVEYDEQRDRYLVRAELFEFLSLVAKRAFESSEHHVTTAELEKIVTVALLPDVREAVEAVLQHLHPINETDGFTSELLMPAVERDNPGVARSVRSVLNAGATLKVVRRDGAQPGRYLVHGDLYKALARIRARSLVHSSEATLRASGALQAIDSAGERSETPTLMAEERRQITHQAHAAAPASPHSEDEAVRAGYRDALLAELGLGAPVVEARLASEEAERAAFAAWKKLNLHAGPNPKLASFVRGHQDEVAQRLKRAFDRLQRQIGGDPHRLELLNEADTSVQRLLPVLVMFPEVGLVGAMVDGLERAAQHDDGQDEQEQELLERLRRVREALRGDLRTARAWSDIGEQLEGPDGSSLESRLRKLGGKHLN